ncbi:hypothetical protein M011DRAFT_348585 [Sporormia fimetaria CBS 119925]|uniref:F-box domain-containing protein n=1 Tax=Sporormia fimetaria CBS 119925 TaxID=1340428 RepID=A0A6A6VFS2_9PLEO|nr:hypothetical protein M011DRAFT_348585 [Sporormia fimetaria CBS 119925]
MRSPRSLSYIHIHYIQNYMASGSLQARSPPFPLFRLPLELRLEIYGHHLILPDPIELWSYSRDNTTYESSRLRRDAFGFYANEVRLIVRFLRVSRDIHVEATPVFYGRNTFRFSAINGWIVFSAFLHTIRPRHFLHLAHVSVHVPFSGLDALAIPTRERSTFYERTCMSRKQSIHFRRFLGQRGFRVPSEGEWTYAGSFRGCVDLLSRSAALRTLKLVLTPTYCVDLSPKAPFLFIQWYWDKLHALKHAVDASRERLGCYPLKIWFLFLKPRRMRREFVQEIRPRFPFGPRFHGQTRRMVKEIKSRKWVEGIECAVLGYNGVYDIVDRDMIPNFCREDCLLMEEEEEEEEEDEEDEEEPHSMG